MQDTGPVFMEMTRYEHLSPSDQGLRLTAPPLEKSVPQGSRTIPLPTPEEFLIPPLEVRSAIEGRRSVRRYRRDPLTLGELTYLLWCTQGIVHVQEPYYTLRNVPSAGGRHACETYLVVNRVDELVPGLYRYLPFSHQLLVMETGSAVIDRAMAACLGQAFVRASAVTFIWSAVIYRMAWRYSERAYRLVHLDAGHICQNLYISAMQAGCGTCAIGAFDDALMAELIGADGREEFVIYAATVGKQAGQAR